MWWRVGCKRVKGEECGGIWGTSPPMKRPRSLHISTTAWAHMSCSCTSGGWSHASRLILNSHKFRTSRETVSGGSIRTRSPASSLTRETKNSSIVIVCLVTFSFTPNFDFRRFATSLDGTVGAMTPTATDSYTQASWKWPIVIVGNLTIGATKLNFCSTDLDFWNHFKLITESVIKYSHTFVFWLNTTTRRHA